MGDVRRLLGRRLRTLREAQGLSQEALAAAANVSRVYLGSLERGDKVPRIDVVARLAQGLGVTLSKLCDFESRKAPAKITPHERFGRTVAGIARRATPDELDRFEEMARVFFRRG
jgi:transcriptional regulator with XRE-family HTH domain